MLLRSSLTAIVASVLMAGAEPASDTSLQTALLSIGFEEAKLSDYVGTKSYPLRAIEPRGHLAILADFDGDGRPDQARILRNRSRGDVYVVAQVISDVKADTFVIQTFSIAGAENIGIRVAPATEASGGRTGVTVFELGGSATRDFYLSGESFTEASRSPAT